tara:strand:- start:316 stop:843 length:528 start_codon:yes stop_codon:yes gene_type:complete
MALNKLDKSTREYTDVLSIHGDEEMFLILKDLIEKVNTGFDKTNEHINKVTSMQTEINTEKNKTGITSEQATAITNNTAKVGITTSQANAITVNTAKVGITAQQSKAIILNSAKRGMQTGSMVKGFEIADFHFLLVAGKNQGEYLLRLQIVVESRESGKSEIQYIDLPLQQGKGK